MFRIVAAMDVQLAIGRKGEGIPWGRTLKDDLKNFRALTINNIVVMGRRTFTDDIKRPLPERTNVIVTRNPDFRAEGCIVVHSLIDCFRHVRGGEKVFVIGGGEIFKEALPNANHMYLSLVHTLSDGNVFFPSFQRYGDWTLIHSKEFKKGADNAFDFDYQHWIRR